MCYSVVQTCLLISKQDVQMTPVKDEVYTMSEMGGTHNNECYMWLKSCGCFDIVMLEHD